MAKIEFEVPDIFHPFGRSHGGMIQAQDTAFPVADHNPQTFLNIPIARPEHCQKVPHRLRRAHGASPAGGRKARAWRRRRMSGRPGERVTLTLDSICPGGDGRVAG
ncbi:MAG TPA: hypothetical protein VNN17_01495 [Terriglobia bacterium]|nr:hypothetical protein [Terriglobia bacterium]